MNKLARVLTATAITCFISSEVFCASPASPEAQLTRSSSKMATIDANTTAYQVWSAWIRNQNVGDPTTANLPVGHITIGLMQSSPVSSANAVAMDNTPIPVGLPATGTPGERITVINQTSTIYQKWIEVWVSTGGGTGVAGNGGGGGYWENIGYTVYNCNDHINNQSECNPGGGS